MSTRILFFALLTTAQVTAAPALLPGGHYALASQMQMPHLEEMRRIVTHDTRCLAENDLRGLFPVMRQPALIGCDFGYPSPQDDGMRYVLICASARVATGTAALVRTRTGVVGRLQIKMGGKNMTFSQRVEAQRLSDECPAAP